MALKRVMVEIGMGTDIRGEDYGKAAVLAVLPHGTGAVRVVERGLEVPNATGTDSTVIANAAAVVWLDLA